MLAGRLFRPMNEVLVNWTKQPVKTTFVIICRAIVTIKRSKYHVRFSKHPVIETSGCQNVRLSKHPVIKMSGYQNFRLSERPVIGAYFNLFRRPAISLGPNS